jgi:hypothetical protein
MLRPESDDIRIAGDHTILPTFRSLGNGFLEYWSNVLIYAFYA